MALSSEDIARIAVLSRLGLSEDELKRIAPQLDDIWEQFAALQPLDTSQVEVTAWVGSLVNMWREDEARPCPGAAAVLQHAPVHEGDYFKVGAIQE